MKVLLLSLLWTPLLPALSPAQTPRDVPEPEPIWSYSDPGTYYSSFISWCQRLPNGITLICSGARGRVSEVTPEGRVVWDFRNDLGEAGASTDIPAQSLYRARRIPADHPGLRGRLP